MNTKNLIYILSLVFIGVSIFIIIEYPDSGRLNLIAGAATLIEFSLNIVGFFMPQTRFSPK